MNAIDAMAALGAGVKIRKKLWSTGSYVQMTNGEVRNHAGAECPVPTVEILNIYGDLFEEFAESPAGWDQIVPHLLGGGKIKRIGRPGATAWAKNNNVIMVKYEWSEDGQTATVSDIADMVIGKYYII